MSEFLKVYNVTDGILASEVTPDSPEGLYASPEELHQLFGCGGITEADIRFAMGLIHAECNRTSLWPTEIRTSPIEIPPGRQETRLPVTPVISILEAAGRWTMGRRDHQAWNQVYGGLHPYLVLVGQGQPQWIPINVSTIELDHGTGIIYLPWSSMLIPYSMIKILYLAGYISIPYRIKVVLAEIINSVHGKGISDRIRYTAGRVTKQYASDSFLTPVARELLAPFVIRSMY